MTKPIKQLKQGQQRFLVRKKKKLIQCIVSPVTQSDVSISCSDFMPKNVNVFRIVFYCNTEHVYSTTPTGQVEVST